MGETVGELSVKPWVRDALAGCHPLTPDSAPTGPRQFSHSPPTVGVRGAERTNGHPAGHGSRRILSTGTPRLRPLALVWRRGLAIPVETIFLRLP